MGHDIAVSVPIDNAQYLPIAKVIEECAVLYADHAYDEPVNVAGVGQFFPLPFSFLLLSFSMGR